MCSNEQFRCHVFGKDKKTQTWGFPKGIPHSRCHTLDLLEEDKSLKIEVRLEVLDELLTGGHLERRRLLQENNNSLAELKTLLMENIKERERERGECPVCQTTVECPVCSEEVRRPMRLTQCSQVKLFSLSLTIPPPPPCPGPHHLRGLPDSSEGLR